MLGLTFKPNTDDMRDAPSLRDRAGAAAGTARRSSAFDPEGHERPRQLLPGVEFATAPTPCLEGADVLVVVTEWDAFRALDLARVKAAMREPVVVDLRNIYPQSAMRAMGFKYVGIGRGA